MATARQIAKAAADQTAKQAGWKSEMLGSAGSAALSALAGAGIGGALGGRPGAGLGTALGAYAPTAAGYLAALATPTRSLDEQAEADQKHLRNFIPGVGIYNALKRLGMSARSPEMRAAIERQKNKKTDDEKEKEAGVISETLSGFNPLNMYGGSLAGALAAGLTPTRTMDEQAKKDADPYRGLKNMLIPGFGPYEGLKRFGMAVRSPEIQEAQAKAKSKDKAESDDEGYDWRYQWDLGDDVKIDDPIVAQLADAKGIPMEDLMKESSAIRQLAKAAAANGTIQNPYMAAIRQGVSDTVSPLVSGVGSVAGKVKDAITPSAPLNEYLPNILTPAGHKRIAGGTIGRRMAGTGALGGLAGLALGALQDPGEDEEGNKRSRLANAFRAGLLGTGIGAGAGAAFPAVGEYAAKLTDGPYGLGASGLGERAGEEAVRAFQRAGK